MCDCDQKVIAILASLLAPLPTPKMKDFHEQHLMDNFGLPTWTSDLAGIVYSNPFRAPSLKSDLTWDFSFILSWTVVHGDSACVSRATSSILLCEHRSINISAMSISSLC